MARPPIVVYPPTEGGGRRVRVDGQAIGLARTLSELREFLRRAGMPNAEDVDLSDPALVEWRGGGPTRW
ncbi:hypothetical protein RM844_30450 [Streptomyces sp. DSM 44915]|uniref:Uncharacterized protein n=1 Tax=Streptomyces chisholmiae TaxID=3075540 RepID=A0ABU2K073_9ACTN|nr:hypothetical protein [Streptomyces sp. DSM 44915]MDT0270602.1 hypothetical protein [Streptomyces sp. DSM 44915]